MWIKRLKKDEGQVTSGFDVHEIDGNWRELMVAVPLGTLGTVHRRRRQFAAQFAAQFETNLNIIWILFWIRTEEIKSPSLNLKLEHKIT